ncbi:MAG: hypothetical protein JSS51_04085 [Planctomycetes bacterium]|nr:hypothetical protein [Planctomycetota bacterium]
MTTAQQAGQNDAINPLVPEDMDAVAQALNIEQGIPVDKLTIRLFRKQPAPKLKAFVVTYRYRDFSIESVQANYGAGEYIAEVWAESSRVRGCRSRYEFECAGPAIRQPESPAPAPAPLQGFQQPPAQPAAPVSSTDVLLKQMEMQNQLLIAMMNRQAPAPDRWWVPLVAPIVPDIAKKFLSGGGAPMGLGQVREFLDFIEDRKGARDDGTPWMDFVKDLLPVFLQQQAQKPAPQVQTNPAPALPTADNTVRGPAPAAVTAPNEASTPGAAGAPGALNHRDIEAADAAALSLADFLNSAVGICRVACSAQEPDVDSYATILADLIDANNVDTSLVDTMPLGTLADLIIQNAPDVKAARPFLVKLETSVREFYKPDDADPDQMHIDDLTMSQAAAAQMPPITTTKRTTVSAEGRSTNEPTPDADAPTQAKKPRAKKGDKPSTEAQQ